MDEGCSVYILKCSDGSYYVGLTKLDVEARLSEHQMGTYHRRIPTNAARSNSFLLNITTRSPMPFWPSAKSKAGGVPKKKRLFVAIMRHCPNWPSDMERSGQ